MALLLKAGADICMEDIKGRLPIDLAGEEKFRLKALQLVGVRYP